MKTYNKLVRDKIPEVIISKGQTPYTRVLNDKEYKTALLDKLVEEAIELKASFNDIGERADIAEVLHALDEAFDFTQDAVEAAREKKSRERGVFRDRLYLETVE